MCVPFFFYHKSLPTNWTILTDLNRIYFDTLIQSFHLYKLNVFQRICSRYTTNNLLKKKHQYKLRQFVYTDTDNNR